MKKRLLWQIFPSYVLIALLALVAFYWNVTVLIDQFFTHQTRQTLEHHARLAIPILSDSVDKADLVQIDLLCKKISQDIATRITVIENTGRVLGESSKGPASMENHANRPEVQQAFAGKVGYSELRPSSTLKQRMMYVAVPIISENQVVAVVRTSLSLAEIEHTQRALRLHFIQYSLLIVFGLALLSLGLAWKWSRPLALLQRGTEEFARGNLVYRLDILGHGEIADVARTLNSMAEQLEQRIQAAGRFQNEQRAILEAMQEGLIAFDTQGRCLSLNPAAAAMLKLDLAKTPGLSVGEVIHGSQLQQFIQNAIKSVLPAEETILMLGPNQTEIYVQARSSALLGNQSEQIGILIVLNDITRLYQLEQIRRDFVANVSHELNTPITSIQGFIETLQDGAVDTPADARRFLGIIARQADRLNSIIEDLLLLCELEQDGQNVHVSFESCAIQDILKETAELCRYKAEQRQIRINLECPSDLTARVNASLLEQAVLNLADNAIKYSHTGGQVNISAVSEKGNLVISVQDFGCGIAAEHQARIFERFFRVDKARSRQLGGTGLGLAIVKHIVQCHRGTVSVQSGIGKGSIFTLTLPQ
jgi:two-component system phosphate regulon sensor histidine kinase PhoR